MFGSSLLKKYSSSSSCLASEGLGAPFMLPPDHQPPLAPLLPPLMPALSTASDSSFMPLPPLAPASSTAGDPLYNLLISFLQLSGLSHPQTAQGTMSCSRITCWWDQGLAHRVTERPKDRCTPQLVHSGQLTDHTDHSMGSFL